MSARVFQTLLILLLSVGSLPGASAQASKSYIVIDAITRKILLSHDSQAKLPVGSLVKIANACVVDDWMDATDGDRGILIPVPPAATEIAGGNPLGLQPGDYISIRDALFSALIGSDNVSALTLAEHVGLQMWRQDGGRAPGAVDFFVAQMNALATAKGMERTTFVNPHGMDDRRGKGVSTAADMARLTLYAITKPSLNFIVRQPHRDLTYYRNGQPLKFRIFNTNKLLGQEGVEGFKTGRTARAGECLITSARRPDEVLAIDETRKERIPYHILTVTLNSGDRFSQTRNLIHQGFSEYERWIKGDRVLRSNEVLSLPE